MFMRANLNEMVTIDPLDGSAGRLVVNKSVRSLLRFSQSSVRLREKGKANRSINTANGDVSHTN